MLVFFRQRRTAFLVMPEDLVGCETHRQVVAQGFGFSEKLDMAGMDNIITARNKDFLHKSRD
jgi:hypothetical protein